MTSDSAVSPMPDVSHSFAGFRHTIDSALLTLEKLGVPGSRITIRLAGAGTPARWIVSQFPAPGVPLTPDQVVTLSVAGVPLSRELPVGMWDQGDERQPGTAELLEPFDDPIQKAEHWIREGARLFDISTDEPDACARWIRLFGLDPETWSADKWYRLSVLLPNLPQLAGTEAGIRFALELLFDISLAKVTFRPAFRGLPADQLSRLGQSHSRAGIDYIVGDRLEDLAEFILLLGPVTLETYYSFQRPSLAHQLNALMTLVIPSFRSYSIRWSVLDAAQAPRLGSPYQNSVLGINSHLGRSREQRKQAAGA